MRECRESAESTEVGSFITCFTLLFACIGVMNRMRFSSDAPVQKMLGMVTDTWGALSLLWTMSAFSEACYSDIPQNIGPYELDVSLGPGFWAYMFCAFAASHRALMHWLTPVPGMGSGVCRACSFADLPVHPASIVTACRKAKLGDESVTTPLEFSGSVLDPVEVLTWQDALVKQGLPVLKAEELRAAIIAFQPIDEEAATQGDADDKEAAVV